MDPLPWIVGIATNHDVLIYAFLVVLAAIQGPVISLIGGFLLKAGVLVFLPTYLCLMAGELVGDVMWYWLGYRWGHPFIRYFGKYFSIDVKKVQAMEKIFKRYHNSILLASKLTTGLGFAPLVLFTAGLSKVSFRRYMALNGFGQIFWSAGLILVGYALGNFYVAIGAKLDLLSIIATSIIVFLLFFGFGKYLGRLFIDRFL